MDLARIEELQTCLECRWTERAIKELCRAEEILKEGT